MASDSNLFQEDPLNQPDHDCDVCKYQGITSRAISYCTMCSEYLCKPCDTAHRGSKMARDHKILTGSELPSAAAVSTPPTPQIMYCENHNTMLINVYCISHDIVMCGTCKVIKHGECRTSDVKEQTSQMKADGSFGGVADRLKCLKSEYEKLQKMRNGDKDVVKAKIENCLHEVHLFRKAINEKLDELEKKISEELKEVEKDMIGQIENHVTITGDALFQINSKITSMTDCLKSKSDDVMFVGMKKAVLQANEYENSLVKVQKEIYPIEIQFKAGDILVGMIQNLQSLGNIYKGGPMTSPELPSYPKASILNMPLLEESKIDVGSKNVCGATFLSNGQLVIGCINDGLKLLDYNFQMRAQLKVRALNVAALNDTDVIVSQGSDKQLVIVKVIPHMAVEKIVKLGRICVGVDAHGGDIYVTCHDSSGSPNGEVLVLSKDGQLLRRLGVDNGRFMFSAPSFVKVSKDGSKVFVSDCQTHTVTCLDKDGGVLFRYADQQLNYPVGLYVDIYDNLLVCGQGSRNIHVVRNGGLKTSSISQNGELAYWCVSRREADGCLAVGIKSKSNKSLSILKMHKST